MRFIVSLLLAASRYRCKSVGLDRRGSRSGFDIKISNPIHWNDWPQSLPSKVTRESPILTSPINEKDQDDPVGDTKRPSISSWVSPAAGQLSRKGNGGDSFEL